jgi:L-asparaginase / beta-aspartyl-peptidase
MRRSFFALVAATVVALAPALCQTPSGAAQPEKITWAIVIHGGAGGKGNTTPADQPLSAREQLIADYLKTGCDVLSTGGTALDACEKVVRAFEDSGKFNTGKGATSTGKGSYSLDASIMDGSNVGFGAVSSVKAIKNPISAARAVMSTKDHVLLMGPGAEEFAKDKGLEIVPPSYFNATKGKKGGFNDDFDEEDHGTVGCVCLDQKGNIAAATSTGGRGVVLPGRVGDTPICGAGTYANNKTCAVSGTGTGEQFVRHVAAHTISDLMEYKGMSAKQAAEEVVFKILPKGSGGLIVVAYDGEVAHPFNGGAMARGAADSTGRLEVGIGKAMRKAK